ncbi:MAG: bifunctional 5,10-methylenetetrahydrofolate dehydrogenase/5,10-methenyltetrahydrofolate cyclohydrolase [Rickettsiaceae bacterium]|nr:bifunctional 5,10-methylenetetrahydrofolate dehydrogenase/5,10-methenyltetrahydrofolate cyclohydrolase [Rickettsiaceae bacterium]
MIKDGFLIDGKSLAEQFLAKLKQQIKTYKSKVKEIPKLAIIFVGDDPASNIYVKNKMNKAKEVGIEVKLKKFSSDIMEKSLLLEIDALNKDDQISGIIVQLPLPWHINKNNVFKKIMPIKDVDGIHPYNVGLLYNGENIITNTIEETLISKFYNGFVPCTARGVLELIKCCVSELSGKNVVIVGRSNIVGRPLAALLLNHDCTVTICHSKSKELSSHTANADIIILAIGSAKFFDDSYFKKDAIIIDVGSNRDYSDDKLKLVGDVDFHKVKNKAKYITPVPGGVGPMTIAFLLINCFLAKTYQDNLKNNNYG